MSVRVLVSAAVPAPTPRRRRLRRQRQLRRRERRRRTAAAAPPAAAGSSRSGGDGAPRRGGAGGARGQTPQHGQQKGTAAHAEHQQRVLRPPGLHTERAVRHQAVENQNAPVGHVLHQLPDDRAGQRRPGHGRLQGRLVRAHVQAVVVRGTSGRGSARQTAATTPGGSSRVRYEQVLGTSDVGRSNHSTASVKTTGTGTCRVSACKKTFSAGLN